MDLIYNYSYNNYKFILDDRNINITNNNGEKYNFTIDNDFIEKYKISYDELFTYIKNSLENYKFIVYYDYHIMFFELCDNNIIFSLFSN